MTPSRRARSNAGFTLIELLVSMVVLSILLVLLTQLTSSLRSVISHTTSSVDAFKEARGAFETMTRRIAQATLNSYDDLIPPTAGSTVGTSYGRASELRFISGDAGTLITGNTYPNSPYPTDAIFFQAPLGFSKTQDASLVQLLNTCGYFIQWGNDQNLRPSFLPASVPLHYRFRLMELLEPSENLQIYNKTSGPSSTSPTRSASWDYTLRDWFQSPVLTETPSPVRVLAENVVFLAVLPIVAPQNAQYPLKGAPDGTSTDIAPAYLYDTAPTLANPPPPAQNQLPPMVYIMMIAVDEPSFIRYQASNGNSASTPANLGLGGILTNAAYTQRQTDVTQVTTALTNAKISYRIFSIAIPLSAH